MTGSPLDPPDGRGGGHDLSRCGEGEDAPHATCRGPPPGGGELGCFSVVVFRRRNGILSHVGRRDNYLVWGRAGDDVDAPTGRRSEVHFRRRPPLGSPWGGGLDRDDDDEMSPVRPRSWLR